jgi:CheY-like chemotaxis protein
MSTLPGRVMIVEDEVVIALLLETFVLKHGHDVVGIADNFDDAVALFTEQQPDAVLMDVSIMGDRDGVATAAALRAIRDVPVIFLTAYTDPVTLGRLQAGAPHAFLSKPFDEELLASALRSALERATPA